MKNLLLMLRERFHLLRHGLIKSDLLPMDPEADPWAEGRWSIGFPLKFQV